MAQKIQKNNLSLNAENLVINITILQAPAQIWKDDRTI